MSRKKFSHVVFFDEKIFILILATAFLAENISASFFSRRKYSEIRQNYFQKKTKIWKNFTKKISPKNLRARKNEKIIFGDVTNDGEISATDASKVARFAKNFSKNLGCAENLRAADVDNDGRISENDAKLIVDFAVGKISEFPANRKFFFEYPDLQNFGINFAEISPESFFGIDPEISDDFIKNEYFGNFGNFFHIMEFSGNEPLEKNLARAQKHFLENNAWKKNGDFLELELNEGGIFIKIITFFAKKNDRFFAISFGGFWNEKKFDDAKKKFLEIYSLQKLNPEIF